MHLIEGMRWASLGQGQLTDTKETATLARDELREEGSVLALERGSSPLAWRLAECPSQDSRRLSLV